MFAPGNPALRTVATGMRWFVGQNSTGRTYVAAGAVTSIVPIVAVLFLQRYFIERVAGAIKG